MASEERPLPPAKRVAGGARPPSGAFAPMTLPHSMRPRFDVAQADIHQPIMTMRPSPAVARGFPASFPDQVAARRAQLAGLPTVAPRSHTVAHFPHFEGNAEEVAALGEAHLGGLGGGYQGGLYPRDEARTVGELPSHVDLSRHRPAQMLSQLSEVMMHGAQNAGLKHAPVEVQFGYGINEHGHLDVFASANNPDTQNWLEAAMAAPAGEHLANAARSGDPELMNIGAKLMFHDEQQERRRAAVADAPDAAQISRDMELASAIRDKFLSRDITIVKNKSGMSGRHAEQNIGVALHQGGYRFGDIQGTKIRCHSCRSELGSNLTDEAGMHISGKVYGSQASTEHLAASFQHIAAGHEQIATPLPTRPRANSLVSLPAIAHPAAAAAAAAPLMVPPPVATTTTTATAASSAAASHTDGAH